MYGYNEFSVETPEPVWIKFLKNIYEQPLILLLLGSAVVSAFMRNYDDAISISLAILIVLTGKSSSGLLFYIYACVNIIYIREHIHKYCIVVPALTFLGETDIPFPLIHSWLCTRTPIRKVVRGVEQTRTPLHSSDQVS